jgi:integrase
VIGTAGFGPNWDSITPSATPALIAACEGYSGASASAGREHRVPLPDRAVAILRAALPLRTSEFVFPGMKANSPLSVMALEMALRRMKVDATVHGFRSAFRDWTGERTAFPREIADRWR